MRLRKIILVLAFLSFFSSSLGGFLYYSSLRKVTFDEFHKSAGYFTNKITNYVYLKLKSYQNSVKALSKQREIQLGLENKNTAALAKANFILDNYKNALAANVCYLMDKNGVTIASSNRKSPVSFVGKNYAFRPYFKQAIRGKPFIYMALGVTSKKRGVYYSYPVFSKKGKAPNGVVIIKASVEDIELAESQIHNGVVMLTGPNGVIFISSRRNWLFKVLWKVQRDKISEIAKSRQFGRGPWDWTGMVKKGDHRAVDRQGVEYFVHQKKIENKPEWKIVYLHDEKSLNKFIFSPVIKSAGYIIFFLFFLILISAAFLYKAGSDDIIRRKKAEEERKKVISELKDALAKVRTLSGMLPICSSCKKIRNDKGYWEQVEVYIEDHSDAEFSHGICPDCVKKLYPDYHKKIK